MMLTHSKKTSAKVHIMTAIPEESDDAEWADLESGGRSASGDSSTLRALLHSMYSNRQTSSKWTKKHALPLFLYACCALCMIALVMTLSAESAAEPLAQHSHGSAPPAAAADSFDASFSLGELVATVTDTATRIVDLIVTSSLAVRDTLRR